MKKFLATNKKVFISGLIVSMVLLTMAAVTQIDLTTQVKGLLPGTNGGTGVSSTATYPTSGTIATAAATLTSGQLLIGGGTTAVNVGNLSGDATTSGTAAVTVGKINGTTVPTTTTADQLLVTTASATGTWKSLTDCQTGAVSYNTTTHAFGCNIVLTGTIVDNETPSGTIDGTNAAFVMAHTPSPAASLDLFKNGQLMTAGGADYTLATATATFVAGAKPKTGDVLLASYRY